MASNSWQCRRLCESGFLEVLEGSRHFWMKVRDGVWRIAEDVLEGSGRLASGSENSGGILEGYF